MSNNFNFSFPCPHCQKTITAKDFTENHFLISHLQSYFQSKETEYKSQLLQELATNPTLFPAYQQIKQENDNLKLIVEGYKLGTNKGSKEKGEELEKHITERLQEVYNGADDISKITHVGTKADILQIVHDDNQQTVGKIIYEIKNEGK
jgi:hypothetical protein